jgi:hypothetical protein
VDIGHSLLVRIGGFSGQQCRRTGWPSTRVA